MPTAAFELNLCIFLRARTIIAAIFGRRAHLALAWLLRAFPFAFDSFLLHSFSLPFDSAFGSDIGCLLDEGSAGTESRPQLDQLKIPSSATTTKRAESIMSAAQPTDKFIANWVIRKPRAAKPSSAISLFHHGKYSSTPPNRSIHIRRFKHEH